MISIRRSAAATLVAGALSAPGLARAQTAPAPAPAPRAVVAGIPVNYDEAKVGSYTLPDPLVMLDGTRVTTPAQWAARRAEIVKLYEENQFGRTPGRPAGMTFEVFDKGTPALGGAAIRKQVTVYFTGEKSGPKMDLLPTSQRRRRGPFRFC
jgi:hypothetical protein